MIEKILLFVIISFSFLVITKDFMDIYLERKSIPISRRICIWVAFYLMEAIGTEYIKLPVLVLCFQVLLSFFLSCVLYKGGLRKKVFLVFIINVIGMLTEIFVGFVFMFMNLQMTDSINMLGSILSKIIQFMLVICLKIFSSRLKREIDVKHWVILFAVPAGSIIVLNTLFMASETQTENFLETMISSVLILGLNLSIFRIYEDLSEKFELKKQQGIFLKEIELYKNQMEEREKNFSDIRKIKHDINNYFICLDNYLEKGDVEKARTYIEHMIMGKDYVQLSDYKENTGNSIVDMLLHYKVNPMKKYGITLESHIEIPDDVDVDDTDLCVIVGNSLDNAIEAVKRLQKKEMKIINCDIIYRKGALVIRIENMYDGERKKDSKGNYISTKKDDANHGIGLYSVKKIVEKYNGLLTICEDENRFVVQIFMYTTQAKGKSYE